METKEVDFYGDKVVVVRNEEQRVFVPMRRVCENIGLSWPSQYVKLQEREWKEGVSMIETGVSMELCLNLEFLPMFLAKIQIGRVKPQVQPKLLKYQAEARKVLAEAFLRGNLPNHRSEERTMSGDPFLDQIEQTRALYIAQKRQKEIIEQQGKQLAEANLKITKVDSRIDNVVHKRRGSSEAIPFGTLNLAEIRRTIFTGMTEQNISEFLTGVGHPYTEHRYVIEDGAPEIISFCFNETGLMDRLYQLFRESVYVRETPKWHKFTHPKIGTFAFIKEQSSSFIKEMIAKKRQGFGISAPQNSTQDQTGFFE